MIAVIGGVGVGSAIAVVEVINLVINSLFNAQSVDNAERIDSGVMLSLLQENSSSEDDEFIKEFVQIETKYQLQIQKEISLIHKLFISIERCCQSLWQHFPSGIFTPLTWLINGKACRYEFVIVNTENYICLLQMRKLSRKMAKNQISSCSSQQNRKELRTKFLQNRTIFKVMAETKYEQNETMKFSTLCKFSNFALECLKKMSSKQYDEKQLSKLFARSMIYFSKPQLYEDDVLKSIFGLFTDKPNGFARLNLIGIEKSLSQDKKEKIEQFKIINKYIREGKY